jgi:hypothetical protein
LADQSKQTRVPEAFFTELQTKLKAEIQLSRDDFDKCDHHFDRQSDLQLLDFMDKSKELKQSLLEFIGSIPMESNSNPVFYQNYPSLMSVPANCAMTRAKVLYPLQHLFRKILFLVDCSLPPGESFLTDQIRKSKMYPVGA